MLRRMALDHDVAVAHLVGEILRMAMGSPKFIAETSERIRENKPFDPKDSHSTFWTEFAKARPSLLRN